MLLPVEIKDRTILPLIKKKKLSSSCLCIKGSRREKKGRAKQSGGTDW